MVAVLVVGEALIDVVSGIDGQVVEHVGGSPANVATGLARLGHPVAFATHLGADARGERITAHLRAEGVSLRPRGVVAERTCTATAALDRDGSAAYGFDLSWQLPPDLEVTDVGHLHTGSVATTLEPGASAVLEAVQRARPHATFSYDPNVRPALMGAPHEVRAKVEALVGLSDVVKASDEDIRWLYAGAPVAEVVRLWGRLGPAVTVVTHGRAGAVVALGTDAPVVLPAPAVAVVDTVGAGDSFMAGLLSGLLDTGLLGGREARERLRAAVLTDVTPAVGRALSCAAVTVSRAGADPPRRDEL